MSLGMHLKSGIQGDTAQDCLVLRNGLAAPLEQVPVFSLDVFRAWLESLIRKDCRVAAFFALPARELIGLQDEDSPEGWRLFAILVSDSAGRLFAASCTVPEAGFPSFTPRLPQLHLFERELYEQHGLMPHGHPWLKPVRFERANGPAAGEQEYFKVSGEEVHEVAVGPIHAGVIECGHFRFQCLGEEVMHLEISLGYHHRGVETLFKHGAEARRLPLLEATAGDSTVAHAWAYCAIREALSGEECAPRGLLLRALALELERLAAHTGDLGALAGDVGFLPTLSYCGRLRGDWLNLTARLCGNRFGRSLLRPGGTAFDPSASDLEFIAGALEKTARDVHGAAQLMWDAPSVMSRMTGVGVVSKKQAESIGMVGPAARASGLAQDARLNQPLPGRLPPFPRAQTPGWGDVFARAQVRHREVESSVDYCRELLQKLAETPGPSLNQPIRQPAGGRISASLVEGWRGELCHAALTDQQGNFLTYKVVDPSFHNWLGLALALRGQQISDFPLCNKSFNLSYCGHDL